jgi:hypothetical protein
VENAEAGEEISLLSGCALLVKLDDLVERLIRHFSMNSGKRDVGDLQ